MWRLATAAGIASSVATIVLLAAAVVGAASMPVLRALALPLIMAGLAATGYAIAFALHAVSQPKPENS